MFAQIASEAGGVGAANEDYAVVGNSTLVVIDGLTARADTACIHGVSWYARQLGNAIIGHSDRSPNEALAAGIKHVSGLHRNTCDLTHPGTPAAVVTVAQISGDQLRYIVLGDVTLLLDTTSGLTVITDSRMRQTAPAERAEADTYPVGSLEKQQALVRMKRVELAARNAPGGYWAAASDPAVIDCGMTGQLALTDLRRLAALTDGATRLVDPFNVLNWAELLDLLSTFGAHALVRRTRQIEEADPAGTRWPRNKKSDDASVIYLEPHAYSAH